MGDSFFTETSFEAVARMSDTNDRQKVENGKRQNGSAFEYSAKYVCGSNDSLKCFTGEKGINGRVGKWYIVKDRANR